MISMKFIKLLSYLCLILVVAACTPSRASGPTPTPLPALVSYDKAIFAVERGPIVQEQKVLAEIVPSKQDELFFRASGFVTRITVKAGDLVKQGDLLAEQQVDDLLNQLEQARIDLDVTQANLAKVEADRTYAIAQAQIEVTICKKLVELARLDHKNAITQADKEEAQLNLDIAEQNLALAELDLQKDTEQVTTYEQQAVQRSQLAVERLEGLIAERRIVAPYDCVILRSSIRPGQSIDAYDVSLIVGDPTNLVIRSSLNYELKEKVNKNTEVHLYLAPDDEQSYTVTLLPNFLPLSSREGNSSAMQGDWYYFSLPTDAPASEITVGKSVTLIMVLGRKEDALLLPPAAIRSYRGLYFVIVLDGDRRRRVEINKIGLQTSDYWEVIADLQEGDQVLGP